MVEINPRPHKPNLFVQVSVAVISGAAAMYCIQAFHPDASSPPPVPAAPASPPAAQAVAPQASPTAGASEEAPRKAAPPAAVSMLIAPEPGGVQGGVVSVGDDEPAPAPPSAAAAKIPEPAAPPAGKETPVIHLQHSGLPNRFAGSVGHDFQPSKLSPHAFPKKETPKAEVAAQRLPPAPRFVSAPRILDEKGIPQKDIFVPSLLHPEIVPEQPFWDYDRKRKALIAGLIALSGVLYLMFVQGMFTPLVARSRDDS